MLQFWILFILGFIAITHSATEIPSSSDFNGTTTQGTTDAISTISIADSVSEQASSILIDESTAVPLTTTTKRPFRPFLQCNFSTQCFANGEFRLINGSEFDPAQTGDFMRPPRAPTSDVSSTLLQTANKEKCDLPYKLLGGNGTNSTEWDMWFCSDNACPTSSSISSQCTSGLYGLIALDSSSPTKKVTQKIDSPSPPSDPNNEQCLRFYYYFTVDSGENRNQTVQIWIRPSQVIENEVSVVNLTVDNMPENKWQFLNVTFKPASTMYDLVFDFSINIQNQTGNATSDESINFALDDVELYDYNCEYVESQLNQQSSSWSPVVTTIAIETTEHSNSNDTATRKPEGTNLGLILGISLGVGIPIIAIAVGGSIYWKKHRSNPRSGQFDIPLRTTDNTGGYKGLRNSMAF